MGGSLQGEGPQGRRPKAAVGERAERAPQPRRSRGALRADSGCCMGLSSCNILFLSIPQTRPYGNAPPIDTGAVKCYDKSGILSEKQGGNSAMSIRDSYYFALLEVHNGRPISVKTCFKGQQGDLTTLSRTVCRCQKQPDGSLRPEYGFDDEENANCFIDPLTPRERLIILGGGHIALPLCEFAAKCDFSVTVVDDRMDFANEGRFPLAREVICDSFENAINKLRITPYDFVVVITRGHRHDANCLRALFQQREPAYLGMIGSRRRVRGLLDMLKEEGLDEERLGQICTPIGLAIGAVSPAEIAISILSQVIEYKRLHGGMNRAINTSDLDLSVVESLMQVQEPVALVTVVETKGSTPRGMGAMMYVYPDGRIVGSIGGGCSEAAILRDALDIIGTGTYKVIDIDMTGDVAESEGMVCGGIMKVLVEDIPLDVYDD